MGSYRQTVIHLKQKNNKKKEVINIYTIIDAIKSKIINPKNTWKLKDNGYPDKVNMLGSEIGLRLNEEIYIESKIKGEFKGFFGFFRRKTQECVILLNFKLMMKYKLRILEEEKRAERESTQKN